MAPFVLLRFALQLCAWLIGLPLQLMLIAALLRGAFRRFPLIFAYSILGFLTTVVEIPSNVAYYTGQPAPQITRAMIFWLDEALLYPLIFAVVISLVYEATAGLQSRRIVRGVLIGGAIIFAGTSFLIHYDPNLVPGAWMTPWGRDLNFSSVIIDLVLWFLLIAAKDKDHRLLLLSGALGIQFTGEAIGESLRQLALQDHSRSLSFSGSFVIVVTNMVCLYMWWRVFRLAATVPEKRVATAT